VLAKNRLNYSRIEYELSRCFGGDKSLLIVYHAIDILIAELKTVDKKIGRVQVGDGLSPIKYVIGDILPLKNP